MLSRRTLFGDLSRMIAEVATSPRPVDAGMAQWLDYCQKAAPRHRGVWRRLRKLDYTDDVRELTQWLLDLLKREPPPQTINGLWFGLYNPILDDGAPTCQMYFAGSTHFDSRSESNEWVCELSDRPVGGYPRSRVLSELYRAVEAIDGDNITCLGEPFLCHGYLALLVSAWCSGPLRKHLIGTAPARAVVIGHDSGDFYRMAILHR